MEAEYQQSKNHKQTEKGKNEGKRGNMTGISKVSNSAVRSMPDLPCMQVPIPISRNEGGAWETTWNVERTHVPVPVEVRKPEYDGR